MVRVIGNNFVDAAAWLEAEEIEKSGISERWFTCRPSKQLLETAETGGMDEAGQDPPAARVFPL